MGKVILIGLVWVFVSVHEVYAESGVIHVNPSVGYMKFDGDSELKSKVLPIIGIEYMMSDTYGISVSFAHADVNVRDIRENASFSLYYMDGLYYLPRDKHWQPYLAAGIGHRRIKLNLLISVLINLVMKRIHSFMSAVVFAMTQTTSSPFARR